jgi:hypothetical protein
MVTQQERPFMPRNADPLGKEQLALLRTWIEQGAADDAASAKAFAAERATVAKAAAVALEATASADPNAIPMPEAIPQQALHTPMRPGPVSSLARSPRAPLLALPGLQQLLLYNTDLKRIAVLPCALARIGAVAFAEDGSIVMACGGEPGQRGAAVLYDVHTGAVLATCGNERDVPLAAAVHKAAGLVALGGSSKHVRVYRIDDGQQVLAGKHDDFVLSVAFAPDGRWVAAGDRAGVVQVWEIKGGRVFQTLQGHQGAVHALAFDRSGASLLTAGADGTVRLWDVAEAKERWRQNAHPNQQALAVAFGPGDAVRELRQRWRDPGLHRERQRRRYVEGHRRVALRSRVRRRRRCRVRGRLAGSRAPLRREAETADRERAVGAREVAALPSRQLHAAMISSCTICSRMNFGMSGGSKWQRTASRTAVRKLGRSSASVTMETPKARAV